jgi:hypothetical protein
MVHSACQCLKNIIFCRFHEFSTGIGKIADENLTSFLLAICIKKIRKEESVQCSADFFVKVAGGFFFILDRKRLLPLSRKIQAKTHPLSCFFAAKVP